MKKIFYIAVSLLFAFIVSSCEKDEVGGTATQAAAGQWYVTYDGCDANGKVVPDAADFNEGRSILLTYNTPANDASKLYIDDLSNFLGFKGVMDLQLSGLTFSTSAMIASERTHSSKVSDKFTITDGVIVPGGGVQKNGSKTDSISFYLQYETDNYAQSNNYVKYFVHGVRYSGLAEND